MKIGLFDQTITKRKVVRKWKMFIHRRPENDFSVKSKNALLTYFFFFVRFYLQMQERAVSCFQSTRWCLKGRSTCLRERVSVK